MFTLERNINMSLLAIDMGTSACKALVFALSGEVLAQYSTTYIPEFPRPGFAEMDPDIFWNALCVCCRKSCEHLSDPVQAVCLSSHGETFLPTDANGRPTMRAILNQDNRAVTESVDFDETIGHERLFRITGLFAHPMYPIPKILWLKKNSPDVFASTRSFVSLIGYLLRQMGLPAYVDYSLASRYMAFDVQRWEWSDEILEAANLDKARLPVPVPAGTVAGKLKAGVASDLGLPAGTSVVLGGHDQPCCALGSGVLGPGRVADSMGTYECLIAASDSPSLSKQALAASLNSYCHVVPDKFVTLAYFPSGIMVKWFHDLLYANGSQRASHANGMQAEADHYAVLESDVPAGPTHLCITPHLIGTCNPEFNPHVRGLIAGLGPGADRGHLYKGILEGIACELLLVADALAEAVGKFDDIYATGGGTRSMLGLKLRAAITGRQIHIMRCQEAVCLGTAILAGVAVGQYDGFEQAVSALVNESTTTTPDKGMAAEYRDQIARYRGLRAIAVQSASGALAQEAS
jgi:xylulokinase